MARNGLGDDAVIIARKTLWRIAILIAVSLLCVLVLGVLDLGPAIRAQKEGKEAGRAELVIVSDVSIGTELFSDFSYHFNQRLAKWWNSDGRERMRADSAVFIGEYPVPSRDPYIFIFAVSKLRPDEPQCISILSTKDIGVETDARIAVERTVKTLLRLTSTKYK